MSGAKAWLRHPTAILLAAFAYAAVHEQVCFALFLAMFTAAALGQNTLMLAIGPFVLLTGGLTLGAKLEQHGITTHLRNRSKQ